MSGHPNKLFFLLILRGFLSGFAIFLIENKEGATFARPVRGTAVSGADCQVAAFLARVSYSYQESQFKHGGGGLSLGLAS
ncbi:hypothetical protein CANARDRAFT_27522 [[Candida] arabinofermentans NRRL YB-2248]|uniref:Uncharacterized protein n=1 Tax=[Candida] arabinofermentans NRRL YB-2248 TaxID=983967 RepID=A0A1E4T3E4_9ASCO|nr:hypothetical protein CANARDRAFT_27522 [[Candida] arabinofermentans NRRL YB-2248]